MADADLQNALSEYFAECEEVLGRVADVLRAIEHDSFAADQLDAIYRDIHTVKGASQLFSFQTVGELAHAMEASLEPVRRLQIKPTPSQIQSLYVSLDLIEEMIASLKTNDGRDYREQVSATIPRLLDATLEILGAPMSVPKETWLARASLQQNITDPVSVKVNQMAVAPKDTTITPLNSERIPERPVERPADSPLTPTPKAPGVAPVSHSSVTANSPHVAAIAPQAATAVNLSAHTNQTSSASAPAGASENADSASSIRVPVSLLDKLMTLMGEMVLVRNQVLQYANKSDHLEFVNLSQRLDVVTSEIQGEVMKTRMQPISNVLSKFHRVVRDLSRDLGKKIELSLSGSETEVDKTLLEAVKDPIMHIVRNSCDHGIETVEGRRAAGKSETGTVTIRSFHEGGQVVVEISDDGRGLDREKLIAKAIEKGVLSSDKAQQLSDRDAFGLIFAAGFSTAAQVTNVSGRGVGMDVVKTNIEGIGGMVEVQSVPGQGMTIRLKIPLTLAIVPAMIVGSGRDLFAIPQVKLVELVRVEKGASQNLIEDIQGQPVYRLRGNLLPLVTLDQVLAIQTPERNQLTTEIVNIVVLGVEDQMFGLIVDDVKDTAEVVVKPLSAFLKALNVYSGATVLGDGSVALILDVTGIAQKSNILREGAAEDRKYARAEAASVGSEDQEFLLLRVNSPTRHAVPLNIVHRLEEFNRTAIEYSGSQRVVRYRDHALPIISLNEQLDFGEVSSKTPSETLSVIVLQKADRFFGLEVDEILDVLKTPADMDEGVVDRPGIFGNVVTGDEIIVIVDVMQILERIISQFNPGSAKGAEASALESKVAASTGAGLSILFAEDTAFFRKHVCSALQKHGFTVTCAVNGEEALRILTNDGAAKFDVILSDIEMPKMNGLTLASNIRKLDRWSATPLVALTTKFSVQAKKEGMAAGFDAYLEKLKADELMATISQLIEKTKHLQKGVA